MTFERLLGLPVIGIVPRLWRKAVRVKPAPRRAAPSPEPHRGDDPRSAALRGLRTIQTNIQFAGLDSRAGIS